MTHIFEIFYNGWNMFCRTTFHSSEINLFLIIECCVHFGVTLFWHHWRPMHNYIGVNQHVQRFIDICWRMSHRLVIIPEPASLKQFQAKCVSGLLLDTISVIYKDVVFWRIQNPAVNSAIWLARAFNPWRGNPANVSSGYLPISFSIASLAPRQP